MNEDIVKKAQAMAEDFTNEGKSSLGVGTFLSAFNFDPVLFSDLKVEHEDVVWIWEGFLAKGQLTLLSAFWKAGKSTLIGQLLKAMQEGKELAGKPTRPCKTLILSEESKSIWARRFEELGINSTGWVLSRPVRYRLNYNQWVDLLGKSSEYCKNNEIELLIVDTISGFWNVQRENDAGEVQSALLALNPLLESNISVLLIHHFRKSGGEEFTASRGSGALGSSPDILIEFKRTNANDPNSNQRTLQTASRLEESPREVVIELVDGEYITLGTKAEVSKKAKLSYLLSLLPTAPDGLTTAQIVEEWKSDEAEITAPGQRSIRNYLSELQKSGEVVIVGETTVGRTNAPLYGKVNNAGKERPLPIRDFPRSNACYTCGSTKKWRRFDGVLVCAECHPPASGEQIIEQVEEET